jgi:hypothetical protein
MSLGLTAAILQKIDYDQVIRQALQKRGQTVPEDQMSSIIERQKKVGGIFGWSSASPADAGLPHRRRRDLGRFQGLRLGRAVFDRASA